MTRVEKNETLTQEVAAMKDEMVQTVKMSSRKKSKFALGCLIFFIAFFVLLVGSLAWTAAATGLVRLPVISAMAYAKPEPNHLVAPGLPLDTKINNDLTAEINRRLVAGRGQLTDRTITLELPETGFTALFRSLVEESGVKEIDAAGAQIAVIPNQGLELFLPLADNPQASALVVGLQVVPDERGLLAVKITDLQLGAFNLPGFFYRPILDPLIEQNLEQLNRDWGRYATFQDIKYETGQVRVTGTIAVEVLDL